jgi:hypothetical protein
METQEQQQQSREYNEGDVFYLTETTEIGGRVFLEGSECEVLGNAICAEGEAYVQIEDVNGGSGRKMISTELLDAKFMPNRREGAPMTHLRGAEIRDADLQGDGQDWQDVVRKSDITEGAEVMRQAFLKILRKSL